jgi:hypothetical protein
MKPRSKIVLGMLIAIALLLPLLLVWASEAERFVFVRNLQVGEFRQILPDSGYSAEVTDSGVKLANINVVAGRVPNSTNVPVSLQIAQEGSTEIDSIKIQFYLSETYATLFLEAPQARWPETEFHRSDDSTGVIFSVEDLGSYGVGTLRRDFILVRNTPDDNSENTVYFYLEFSMHQKSFLQLTSLEAQTFVDIAVPD